MLSKAQERTIRSLHRKKVRRERELCLVEGQKLVDAAGSLIDFTFTSEDTPRFLDLVTTKTPQSIAGVASVPTWTKEDIWSKDAVIVLDRVQDPGNVGAIMRACLGFNGSLILIESADPTNSKVIRSSAGAMFAVPWIEMSSNEVASWLSESDRSIYRLEKTKNAVPYQEINKSQIAIIVGSEGSGIQLDVEAPSVAIQHNAKLESLNVAQAVTVLLASRYEHIQID